MDSTQIAFKFAHCPTETTDSRGMHTRGAGYFEILAGIRESTKNSCQMHQRPKNLNGHNSVKN